MTPQLADRTRPSKPGWRGWRLRFWKFERLWRDLVPLIALAVAAYSVFGVESAVERQREGRRIAIDVLCGGVQGVEDGGRAALTGHLAGYNERRLPRAQRRVAALAASDYARRVSDAVIRQAGVSAVDVLKPNGTIDCNKLARVARATGPQQ